MHGLRIGEVCVDEAMEIDRTAVDLDIVRVVDPAPDSWPALRAAGFAVKPAWITWLSPVMDSEESFLERLSANERRNVRLGLRFVEEEGITFREISPITPDALDDFLCVYRRQVAGMPYGVAFACQQRGELLAEKDSFLLLEARAGDEVIGGCLCWLRPDVSTLQIRFVTTVPSSRQNRLVRAMYMRGCELARGLGYERVSLGSDPTVFGHMARPGLFSFKARLGFVPVPARLFASDPEPDEADLVVRLGTLSEPSLILSYHHEHDSDVAAVTLTTPFRLDVVTSDADTDISPYRSPFLADLGLNVLDAAA